VRAALVVVSLAVAVLEVLHPAWTDGDVAEAVASAGSLWLPLHVGLLLGYALLVWCVWRLQHHRRHFLLLFGVLNSLFLLVDGVLVGLLASTDPAAADALWSSPVVFLLANLTGATWSLALLVLAAHLAPGRIDRWTGGLFGATWLVFVASALPLPVGPSFSRAAAVATAGWLAYRDGRPAVPAAVLVFGAVLRQHVGAEAALGLVCLAVAVGLFRSPVNGGDGPERRGLLQQDQA
jgi:hypothetical protein